MKRFYVAPLFISRKFAADSIFEFSGSIIYIHLLLNFLFLIGAKFFIKSVYHNLVKTKEDIKHVLIYGAGVSGLITYDALTNDTKVNNHVVGFIDDNTEKIGKKINMLPVYSLEDITKKISPYFRLLASFFSAILFLIIFNVLPIIFIKGLPFFSFITIISLKLII